MESFCRAYYDSQLFHAIVDGEDGSQKILDTAFQQLTDSNQSFSKINRTLFEREMTAMNLEFFAFAFFRRFSFDKAVQHRIFTLRYLKDKDRNNIWESMVEYSRVIAQTAFVKANGEQMTGDTRIGRGTITRVNVWRFGLFKDWLKSHFNDPENPNEYEKEIASCVALVCNHVEADILRRKQIGIRQIAALFLSRLGAENIWGENWEPSEDFLLRIASQPYSMYDFSTKILKTVDLRFS